MKEYAVFSATRDGDYDCVEFSNKAKALAYAKRIAKDDSMDVVYVQVGDGDEVINIKL